MAMKLPRQYAYNPGWRILILTFGSGLAWISLLAFIGNHPPSPIGLSFGLLPILMGLLLTVRRLVFKRHLILDRDALMVPTGFLRIRTKRIPYMDIERVWQVRLLWANVLCVDTKQGKFEIVSTLLPETDSVIAIGAFLNSKARQT